MSKSEWGLKGCLYLTDDSGIIKQKIQKAVTDSKGGVKMSEDWPEVANLLWIYASLKNIDERIVDTYFAEDNMFTFKTKLADALIDEICPIGEKIHHYMQ